MQDFTFIYKDSYFSSKYIFETTIRAASLEKARFKFDRQQLTGKIVELIPGK